jgi:signal transduction histidine kinase/ABC-type uncharacterized transport system substrate-binding protein
MAKNRMAIDATSRLALQRFAFLLAATWGLAMASSVAAAAASASAASPAASAATRNVLVLFSGQRRLPANIQFASGVREVLLAPERKLMLFEEYLDQPTFTGADHEQTALRYLRGKYESRPPVVVVAVGQFSLRYLLRHRPALFANVPIVHAGVERQDLEAIGTVPGVVGIPAGYDLPGTIELALRLHPGTRRFVVITGSGERDRVWESDARDAFAALKPPRGVEYVSGEPTEAVLRRVRALGKGDIVYTPGYFKDGAGRTSIPADIVKAISAESGAPVYTVYSSTIGLGPVGGRTSDFVDMGKDAATVVDQLLAGVRAEQMRLPPPGKANVEIDWRQVQKWQIDAADLPADAMIRFREPSFWEAHRNTALLVLVVILFQAALIGALLVERRIRRQAASALDESEKQMNLAARAAGLSFLLWDTARHPRSSERRKVPEVADERPVALDRVLETVHPADREGVERAVVGAAADRREIDLEYRVRNEQGDFRWTAARGRVSAEASDRLTGVAWDIHSRKVAELQAEADRGALTHMTRVSTMGQLSTSIAHQLNQPLAASLGNAEVARKMLDRDDLDLTGLREICDDIVADNLRAADVVGRLSALFRRGEMNPAPLNLNLLVKETLDLVHTELLTRHVSAATELAPGLPTVLGSRVHLQQVLLNLILNGANAMTRVAAAERKLVIRTEVESEEVCVSVIDNGSGIAPEDLGNIFEPLGTPKDTGSDVGLVICRSILEAHHGTLTASINADGGATFCARWPLRRLS